MTYVLKKKPCWKVKDLDFEINTDITEYDGKIYVELCSSCMKNEMIYNSQWDYIKERYSAKDVEALVGALEKCDECPQSESQLGVAWEPFRKLEHLSLIWKRFYEYKQRRILNILLEGCGCPNIISLDIGDQEDLLRCAYQEFMLEIYQKVIDQIVQIWGSFFWRRNGGLQRRQTGLG